MSEVPDTELDCGADPTLADHETGYIHATKEIPILGRSRQLVANHDFSDLLLIDDNGGFTLDYEYVFLIVDELIERIVGLQRKVR